MAFVVVAADLGVLLLSLFHEFLQLLVVALCNRFGCHLHDATAAFRRDGVLNLYDGFFEDLDACILLQTLRGEDVQRGSDELDFDRGVGGVLSLSSAEGVLDSVDAFVAVAGNFDVRADLGRLRSQALGDVGLKLGLNSVRWKLDAFPDIRVAALEKKKR